LKEGREAENAEVRQMLGSNQLLLLLLLLLLLPFNVQTSYFVKLRSIIRALYNEMWKVKMMIG